MTNTDLYNCASTSPLDYCCPLLPLYMFSGHPQLLQFFFFFFLTKAGGLAWRDFPTPKSHLTKACMCAQLLQLCLTLCNPLDCSPLGFSVHGILQPRILEWVVIPSSRGYSQPRDWTHVSCISCIGSQGLYHHVTWKTPDKWPLFNKQHPVYEVQWVELTLYTPYPPFQGTFCTETCEEYK